MARRGRPDLNRVEMLQQDAESKARLVQALWNAGGHDIEDIQRVTGLTRKAILTIICEI